MFTPSAFPYYQLAGELGSSGCGYVSKAYDEQRCRTVALKTWYRYPGQGRTPDRAERFRNSSLVSALHHGNIVASFDYGEWANTDFTVMEYIEGRTLESFITSGELSFEKVIDYGRQISRGLGAAHSIGIWHHDLKPSSILIDENGVLKILEFGPSLVECEMPGTMGGVMNISKNYRAPEFAQEYVDLMLVNTGKQRFDSRRLKKPVKDHRADIFSAGVILYEMLTGKRPFDRGHYSETMFAVVRDEPPSLESLRPDLPPSLSDLVARALRKNMADRYASAFDIVRDLNLIAL